MNEYYTNLYKYYIQEHFQNDNYGIKLFILKKFICALCCKIIFTLNTFPNNNKLLLKSIKSFYINTGAK